MALLDILELHILEINLILFFAGYTLCLLDLFVRESAWRQLHLSCSDNATVSRGALQAATRSADLQHCWDNVHLPALVWLSPSSPSSLSPRRRSGRPLHLPCRIIHQQVFDRGDLAITAGRQVGKLRKLVDSHRDRDCTTCAEAVAMECGLDDVIELLWLDAVACGMLRMPQP